MSCAKKKVLCILLTDDGESFVGENWCHKPQETCPRGKEEDYLKCTTVCFQHAHAEIDALEKAGEKAKGAEAYLIGHDHFCRFCKEALERAGVRTSMVINSVDEIKHLLNEETLSKAGIAR